MSTAPPSVVRSFDVISRVYDNPLVQRVVYRANHDAVISALRTHGARRVADGGCGTRPTRCNSLTSPPRSGNSVAFSNPEATS